MDRWPYPEGRPEGVRKLGQMRHVFVWNFAVTAGSYPRIWGTGERAGIRQRSPERITMNRTPFRRTVLAFAVAGVMALGEL